MVLAVAPLGSSAQTGSPSDSPFAAVGDSASGPGAAPPEAFELAGASATGQGTQVCIYNSQTKHSNWIAVGASGDGLKVLSFDPDRDQAVVTMNGERKVLSLRKATVTAAPVASFAFTGAAANSIPGSAPTTPVNTWAAAQPPAPTDAKSVKDAHDAREARMMISDLMEIGIEQRKAYAAEVARQKAAAQAAAGGQ